MKTQLIMMAICLVIGGYIGWSLKPDKDCPDAKPIVQIEYHDTTYNATNVKPTFTVRTVHDTLKFRDTVFVHQNVEYIAAIDTTYKDSSLTASVAFVSDKPLSENSFFDMQFKVREKVITNTVIVTEEAGFWDDRFIPYLGIGVSYDGEVIEPSIELGFGIKLN